MGLFVVAVLVAAYTGFRVPNLWTTTLDAVSLSDGFHRRFLVGTMLRPLAVATEYDYWLFATKSYLVLAAILLVLGVAVWRSQLVSQRLLIIGWLLLPTGGFLFNEVGYFEQLLYLLLFGALWLLHRNHLVGAAGLMAVTAFVHEIAILTVIPVFALAVLRVVPIRRALVACLPAISLNLFVLAVPPASTGSVRRLGETLAGANFRYRADALALFERTQSENWELYPVKSVMVDLVPIALLLIVTFFLITRIDDTFFPREHQSLPTLVLLLGASAAIGAPTLLGFAGWDTSRWAFLLVSNFFLVLWIFLGHAKRQELSLGQVTLLMSTLLIITHVPLPYHNRYEPRPLQWKSFSVFVESVVDGSLFKIPTV